MKAMILAAGLGTRLKPHTDHKPKALIEINGIPLLEHVVLRLIQFGYTDFIVNVHHYPEQIIDLIRSRDFYGQRFIFSDERGRLLDTGGGLLKASWFFDDKQPFLVHNTDVISDIDLHTMRAQYSGNVLVTLAVRERDTSRYFLFDKQMQLCGWENKKTGEVRISRESANVSEYAFSGIQIISPGIFEQITESRNFSLTDLYIRLCGQSEIRGFVHNEGYWFDAGKPEEIKRISEQLKKSLP